MSRILRFFALVAVVFFSVNAFAGDPYGSCSARKVYTECIGDYVLQDEECVPYCSAGQYWDGYECQECTSGYYCPGGTWTGTGVQGRKSCPSTHPSSEAGASSESECYKLAELMKNGGSGTCFGKTGTLDGTITCYYGSTCALPSWNSSSCNMTNGSKIFQGWSLSDDATTGTTGDFEHVSTYYAVWVTPSCNITNGTGTATTASSNKPRCNVTCNSGYGTSGTYTGSAGATSVSYTCTITSNTCPEGQYWNGSACVAITYTVKYNANGGSGTMQSSSHTYGVAKALTANGFTRTGYTFAGWATSSSGDVVYTDQQSVTNLTSTQGATVNLYAKWTAHYFINLNPSQFSTWGTQYLYTIYGTNVYLDSNRSQAMTTNANNITKPTRTGYTFDGYYSESGGTGTKYIDADGYITSDGLSAGKECTSCTWYAKWTAIPYTVSFDANGGTGGQTASVTATYGSALPTISTTKPTRPGYTFDGWYDAPTGGTQYYGRSGNSVRTWDKTADTTLYAQWAAGNYYIYLTPNPYSTLGTQHLYTTYGTNVYLDSNRSQAMTTSANPITKPTRDNYTFAGYYSESDGTGTEYINADGYITSDGLSAAKECTSYGDCKWYVKWTGNTYTVSFNANGGTGGQTASVTATYGSAMPTISTTAPTRAGYTFSGWYDAQTGGTQYYTAGGASARTWNKTANTTLYARWTGKTYTVLFDANGGTGGQTASVTATYGSPMPTISTTAPTRTGYTFNGWYDFFGNQYYTAAGDSARDWDIASYTTLYAGWTANEYSIVLSPGSAYTAAGTTDLYTKYGTNVYLDSNRSQVMTIDANPITKPTRDGYTFDGYYSESGGTGAQYIDVDGYISPAGLSAGKECASSCTWYAHWTANTYTVSFNANGGTGGQTDDVTATYGNQMPPISTTKPTRTGYYFNGWYDAQTGGTQYYNADGSSARTWNKTADTTLYAQWTARNYSIRLDPYVTSGTTRLYTTYDTNVYLDSSRSQAMTTNAYNITKPTRTGYTFGGYYSGSGGTGTQYIDANGYITSDGLSAGKECASTDCTWYAKWTANTYTVSFNANGGTGGQTASVTATYGSNMPTISTTKPTRTGYYFNGWYDAPTGGTKYYNASGTSARSWNKTADTTLYAQWTANYYLIRLSTAQTDATRTLYTIYGTNVYLDSNRSQAMTTSANPVTKPTNDGHTFGGYYSESGGTGTQYIDANGYITSAGLSAGKECASTSGCKWYEKWIPDCYQITLDNTTNGGTGGTTVLYKPYNSTLWYSDSSCSTQVTTITVPTKTNAVYIGHDSSASGGGVQSISDSGNLQSWRTYWPITLYARYNCDANWRGSGTTISGTCTGTQSTVSFDANGGTGGQTASVTATYDSQMPEISTTPPTRTGYTFMGWYDAQTGGTQYYSTTGASARTWDKTENTTLYAQWAANNYSISLNPSPYSTSGTTNVYTTYGTNVYLNSNRSQAMTTGANPITKPTRTGYTFGGYYSESGGTGTEYINANGYITSAGLSTGKECASSCTWYAKWIPDCYQITLDNTTNGGTGGTTVLYKPHGSTLWYSDSSCSTQVTTITKPTKTNAIYTSHFTSVSGGGTQYISDSGNLQPWTVTRPITLYARYNCGTNWLGSGTEISGTCTGTRSTVSFNANGGTGGQTDNVTATYGSEMPEISTTPPTRTGYTFDGWYSAQNGGNQYYTAAGASARDWDKATNTTLYARWTVNTYRCTSGQYLNVTSCETCTAGYYCPSSSATYTYDGSVQGRTACGDGKYSSAGATSCSNITAGCYGTSASSSCPAVCGDNKYSDAGASSCSSCDSDYANSGTDAASHAGVASCKVTCAAGTYVASANAACTDVGSGYYTTASQTISQGSTGSRSACSSLNAFYTASDSGRNATTDCYGTTSSGKYVSTAKSGEVTCAAGGYCAGSVKVYYNSTGGRTACGAGKYNASTGSSASSACTNITAGCYGTSASSSCPAVCAANTYSNAGASSCSSCPTDYKNSGDTAASHAGSASCMITVSGGYYIGAAGDNSNNWDKCACGTYKASHTVAYGGTSSCATTDAGYYAAAGASSQTKATAGYYAAAGACSQTACSGRTKYSAAGAASCSTVSTGYYTTGCNSSSNACTSQTICAKGTYCSSGVAYDCPGGTYGSTTGLSTNACSGKCTAGYYCPAGSTSATQNACATNATSAAGSDAISDCVCKAGYSGDASTSSGTCTACACGYYKGSTGNTSCTKTTAGYYAAGTGNTGQTKATAGNYAAAGACNQSSCADLGGGLYSSSAAGSDATDDCYATVPATKYLSSSTSTSFTTCTAGYYCPGKTLYYASTDGRTACGGGKYSEEGSDASSDCKTISAGCYGASASSACPNTCAPGSYSTGGASGCTICGNKPTNSSYTDARGNTSADCPWTCNDGYNQTSDNQCGQFCTAGITHIKSSNGLSVPLYSSARTSPAINVKVNDSVCYGSLATGQSSGALNVRVGSTTYHSIN